jgi:translation initiation factor IF-3
LKGKETREAGHQFPINEKIKAQKVQLITHDGSNVGVVSRREALDQALQEGLDLVQIAPENREGIPVVKILNYGKLQYEKKKKQVEAKKAQAVIQVKEIKIRPSIAENDFQIKMKQMIQFLTEGKRVKVALFFKGREIVTLEKTGLELFEKIQQILVDAGFGNEIVKEEDGRTERSWSYTYYVKAKK